MYHNPVLLKESIEALNIHPSGIYVDVTFGGGGHSKEILKHLGPEGKLIAFDQDVDAVQNNIEDPRFTLISENFRYLKRFLKFYGVGEVDGILADLGVSSHQFDESSRGFSIRFDAPLDMRMRTTDTLTAAEIINQYAEEKLAHILFSYGELRNSRAMAYKIVSERTTVPVETSFQLKAILKPFLPAAKENKILAQVFQALRIEVNQELEVLKEFITQIPLVLKPEGRAAVISYHSLEDRLVKYFFRSGNFDDNLSKDMFGNVTTPLKKIGKLVVPSAKEIKENSRARSAKLRVAEKK